MYIKKIDYLDKEYGEAFITFADYNIEFECFICESKPLKLKENDKVLIKKMNCLETYNIYRSNKIEDEILYKDNEINISCRLLSNQQKIAIFKEIEISLSSLPVDLKDNDFIEFSTNRLDIFEKDIIILN